MRLFVITGLFALIACTQPAETPKQQEAVYSYDYYYEYDYFYTPEPAERADDGNQTN